MEDGVSSILDKIISAKEITEKQEFNPEEAVTSLLKFLSAKEEEVLRLRFGLGGQPRATLEAIGKARSVTRERVRQIQNSAIIKIKNHKQYEDFIGPIRKVITSILNEHGGAMSQEMLIKNLLNFSSNTSLDRQFILFILEELLTGDFKKIAEGKFKSGWQLKEVDQRRLEEAADKLLELIKEINTPFIFDYFLKKIKETDFYQANKNFLTDKTILSYLDLIKEVAVNPFGEYGLTGWGTIVPRRMSDKIYLVLKNAKKPCHFEEITELINKSGFSERPAHAPTVHNELILNDQYILVGRGIYALKEWGYKPGVVAEVLVEILKKAGQPMSRDELVEQVLAQRIVKKNTIYLALTDKNNFKKLADGRFELAQKI